MTSFEIVEDNVKEKKKRWKKFTEYSMKMTQIFYDDINNYSTEIESDSAINSQVVPKNSSNVANSGTTNASSDVTSMAPPLLSQVSKSTPQFNQAGSVPFAAATGQTGFIFTTPSVATSSSFAFGAKK